MSDGQQNYEERFERIESDIAEMREQAHEQKIEAADMKKMLKDVHEFIHGDPEAIEQRSAIDDIRLMRMIYTRFKSFRFIMGAFVGGLTFLATAGYAIYKIIELLKMMFQPKTG